jgi:hypothetical protein
MGVRGQLRGVEDQLIKDLEETTDSFRTLGKKYGVSGQAIFAFAHRKGIKGPQREKREHIEECSICQRLIGIAGNPDSDFIPSDTIIRELGIVRATFLKHIRILREKGLISQKFGELRSRDHVPGDTFKKISPRRLRRRDLYGWVYNRVRKMILSDRLKRGRRFGAERLAKGLGVGVGPVRAALIQLERDKLVVRKGRKGAFVSFL